MKKHFETFKGVNACNKNKKDNMTTDWEKVKCGRCKKNDEFKMARQLEKESQELSACGRNLEEFLEACKDDCSNVEYLNLANKWQTTYFEQGDLDYLFKRTLSNGFYEHIQFDFHKLKLSRYRIKEPNSVEVINKNIKDSHPICPNCYTLEGEEHQSFCTYESDIKKQESYAVDASDEYSFENCDKFKPKQYTISEEQMNDIEKLLKNGINPKVIFSNNFKEMKDNAWDIKEMALFKLNEIINKIKGV